MTQEDKQLLLTDLCARLPYGVKIMFSHNGFRWDWEQTLDDIQECDDGEYAVNGWGIHGIKPYLRPMSSMTEEEFDELKSYSGLIYGQLDLASYQNGTYKCLDFYLSEIPSDVVILVFNWLNKNHFDYRGLIERGLAIEVTEENNPYKKSSLA